MVYIRTAKKSKVCSRCKKTTDVGQPYADYTILNYPNYGYHTKRFLHVECFVAEVKASDSAQSKYTQKFHAWIEAQSEGDGRQGR